MRGNSRRNWRTRRVVIIATTLLVALILIYTIPTVVRFVGGVVLQPILLVDNWVRTSEQAIPVYFRSRTALLAERQALEQQVTELTTLPEYVAYLEAENAALRAAGVEQIDRIRASVLAQPPYTPHDTLILNVGTDAGVLLDAPVFLSDRVVLGTITAVTAQQSVVRLMSTPGVESTVYIYGPDIYTTAEGYGSGIIRIGVPQGIQLRAGDLVVAPSLGGGVLGPLFDVASVPTQPEQYGYVRLPQALHTIHAVTVGRDPVLPQSFAEAREAVDAARDALLTVPVPAGVLVDLATSTGTTTASTTNTTTP